METRWKIEVVGITRNGRIPSDKPKEGKEFVIAELRMTYIGEHESAEATGSATDFDYSLFTEEGGSIPTGLLTAEPDLYSNSDIPALDPSHRNTSHSKCPRMRRMD
jgi:hypothetical protein